MNDLKDLLGARLFLLDMDGTFYLGDRVLEGSMEFLDAVERTSIVASMRPVSEVSDPSGRTNAQ